MIMVIGEMREDVFIYFWVYCWLRLAEFSYQWLTAAIGSSHYLTFNTTRSWWEATTHKCLCISLKLREKHLPYKMKLNKILHHSIYCTILNHLTNCQPYRVGQDSAELNNDHPRLIQLTVLTQCKGRISHWSRVELNIVQPSKYLNIVQALIGWDHY